MAKQRIVNTKFWKDSYTNEMAKDEKLLFLYLLTNASTNIAGLYELPIREIVLDTGIDRDRVIEILDKFKIDEKVFYEEGWVCLKNFLKHQSIKSPKVTQGIKSELSLVPSHILEKFIGYGYGMDSSSHLNSNSNLNPNLNSNLNVGDSDSSIQKFNQQDVQLANLLYGLILKNTPTFLKPDLNKWADHVRLMRERDSRTYEQIKFVIEWAQADSFWKANILSTGKLREKFDVLVAQIKRKVDSQQLKNSNVAFS